MVTRLASHEDRQCVYPTWSARLMARQTSWPAGVNGDFTAVVATGKATGWAFDGTSGPTAWQRNGSTWTEVRFPGKSGEAVVAAGATSPSGCSTSRP
jgi:hypothetical protein